MSFIIRLQNLSRVAKSTDIRAFFSSLTIPSGAVCIVGGDSSEAYIGFATDEDARQAMLRDGLVLCQNRVKLSLSSRKEMQEAMERAQQMSSLMKSVEKVISPISNNPNISTSRLPSTNLSNPNVDFNQVNTKESGNYNPGTSWISSPNKPSQETSPAPAVDNSWKDFLEQALQRIEQAKDSNQSGSPQQVEQKTGTSLLGPPRNFNNQDNRPKFGKQQPVPKAENFQSFRPPNKQTHQYAQIDPDNGSKFASNNYRQAHQAKFPGPNTQKTHIPPKFSPPPNKKFPNFNQQNLNKMEPQRQDPPVLPIMETESALRQQQLAAMEQMSMPTVTQVYDPEELFVEFSRLPPNLIDINEFKQFLLPVVPVELRVAYSGGSHRSNSNELKSRFNLDVHMCTVCFFANQADANSFVRRDGEAGIKWVDRRAYKFQLYAFRIRWSGRHAFYALPVLPQILGQLNPQVWELPANDVQPGKRPLEPPFHGDAKRAKIDHYKQETSWTTPANSVPNQRDPVFYVLLVNMSFSATNWDISKSIEELGIRALNITHVYAPDSERSDKWLVEFGTIDEAIRLAKNPPFLYGRQSQSDIISEEIAQDIYENGYKGRWQKQSFQHRVDNGKQSDYPNAPNFNQKPHFPPKPINNNPAPNTSKQGQQSGGFFSGSVYGKIRSGVMPNPSSSTAPSKSNNHHQNEQYEPNGKANQSKGFGFGRGRGGNFRGASRGFKSNDSFRPSGPPSNRGNSNHSRGNSKNFRGGRRGFNHGNGSRVAI